MHCNSLKKTIDQVFLGKQHRIARKRKKIQIIRQYLLLGRLRTRKTSNAGKTKSNILPMSK